ncbi:type IIL restriction-modification enzyme MmeI [Streptococcus uberis]|uniref:type IIL restriction-modification enzyme MmeI n=1 Tax=Streptococcus uberis TaxID=1349 RepID=UPI00349EE9A0
MKNKITKTAQAILDARALYPESSLANMYGDKQYLYPELLRAHQENDKAVMEAYGLIKLVDGKRTWLSESETVTELFNLYEKISKK